VSSIAGVLAKVDPWHVEQGESLRLILDALPDECVDGLITDGPYSSGGQFRGDRVQATGDKYVLGRVKLVRPDFAGDTRDQRSFQLWCVLWLTECLRILRPGSPICLFTDWRQIACTIDALQAAGFIYRGIVPWDKTEGCRPQAGRFASQCEYVVWGSAGEMPADRISGRCLPGITRHFPNPRDKWHQTGKPVPTMEGIVEIVEPDGIVLDLFCGSGSTGVAARRRGRRFLGFGLVPEYVTISRDRIAADKQLLTLPAARAGQTPLFGGGAG
jgi:site-specific DNA-methyltransferase (adenine-specific)